MSDLRMIRQRRALYIELQGLLPPFVDPRPIRGLSPTADQEPSSADQSMQAPTSRWVSPMSEPRRKLSISVPSLPKSMEPNTSGKCVEGVRGDVRGPFFVAGSRSGKTTAGIVDDVIAALPPEQPIYPETRWAGTD